MLKVIKGVNLRVEFRVLKILQVILKVLIIIMNLNNKVIKLISCIKFNFIKVIKDKLPYKRNEREIKI